MPLVVTWMNLEITILSEVNQTEKDKYHMISTSMWSLKKKDTNELIYKIEIDSQIQKTNLWLAKGKRGKVGITRILGVTYAYLLLFSQ